MTGQLTMYGARNFVGSFFGRATVIPDAFFVALCREVEPNAYISGAELDEPDALGYERAIIENTIDNWELSTPNVASLNVEVPFADPLADWGTVRYWALCDEPADGMPLIVGRLPRPYLIQEGDTLTIFPGQLSVELGPFYATWET